MCASSSVAAWPPGRPGVVAVAAPHQRTPARRPLLCSGHPQPAAVSAADGAVRTPAAVPRCYGTTGHCRGRPDGRSRIWPPLLYRTGGWGGYAGRTPIILTSLRGCAGRRARASQRAGVPAARAARLARTAGLAADALAPGAHPWVEGRGRRTDRRPGGCAYVRAGAPALGAADIDTRPAGEQIAEVRPARAAHGTAGPGPWGAEGGSPMPSTIIRSPYPDVTIPDLPLPAFVFADAAKHAAKPALIDGLSGRALSYRELVGGARLVAGGLAARGLQPGEVFAIYCPNLPEYAVAFYGVLLAGGTNTTINPLYTVEELTAQLNDAGASHLLTVPPFLDKAVEAAGRAGVREVFVLGEAEGATPFAALLHAGRQPPEVAIDPHTDRATLPYSSGTTGLPKGVMLTHHNLVANLCQCEPVLDVREDEVGIAVLPFFHSYGQVVLMAAALWQGATLVTMPRFDLEQFLTILQDYRVTS